MKRLLSFLMVFCMMLAIIPGAAFALTEEEFKNTYGFTINGIGNQLSTVYGNSLGTHNQVFIIDFTIFNNVPSADNIHWSFNVNENDGKDYSGISLSFTIDIAANYSYCHGICDVILSSNVEPGNYFFQLDYFGQDIHVAETHDILCCLTVSEAPSEPTALVDKGRSLSLSDILYINDYVEVSNPGAHSPDYIKTNGGLLVFTCEVDDAMGTYDSLASGPHTGYIVYGLLSTNTENLYTQRTHGITSKQYRDNYYLRFYLQLQDGTYIYSPVVPYGVHVYCENKLADGSTASAQLKEVCRLLLEYGDAARSYFNSLGQ